MRSETVSFSPCTSKHDQGALPIEVNVQSGGLQGSNWGQTGASQAPLFNHILPSTTFWPKYRQRIIYYNNNLLRELHHWSG